MADFRADWLSKSLAGSVLGFTLAIALAGLFAVAGPGGLEARNKYQFVMWLVAPIWLGVASPFMMMVKASSAASGVRTPPSAMVAR